VLDNRKTKPASFKMEGYYNVRPVAVFIAAVFSFIPLPSLAQSNNIFGNQIFAYSQKSEVVRKELDKWESSMDFVKNRNGSVVDNQAQTTPDYYNVTTPVVKESQDMREEIIELTIGYLSGIQGQQIFEIIDNQGRRVTKLIYPHRGAMLFFNGELRLLSRFFIGGKYGNSHFDRVTSTDTNWLPAIQPDVWWEANSRCKAELEIYDINFYLRLIDSENLSLDVLSGYQHQKGRYGMTDLVDTVEWWNPTSVAYNGFDSFYKIIYKGPRLGLRTEVSGGKYSARLSFAYSWLKTKGYGWWNLMNYAFEQIGDKGYGLDMEGELSYKLTPRISAGLGYNYFLRKQERLKESGSQPGVSYDDLDIVRNADSKIYGPYAVLRFNW
jgi:hypothetical protein